VDADLARVLPVVRQAVARVGRQAVNPRPMPLPPPPLPPLVVGPPADYMVKCNVCGWTKRKSTPGGCPQSHTGGFTLAGPRGVGALRPKPERKSRVTP
jgi:hypothetical protein